MKIQVTQEDVNKSLAYQAENGTSNYACNCPVANALYRQTGKAWEVFDGYLRCEDGRRTPSPTLVRRHVDHFDSWSEMPDFEFDLDLP